MVKLACLLVIIQTEQRQNGKLCLTKACVSISIHYALQDFASRNISIGSSSLSD